MEQRRRRRVTDPELAAHTLAVGTREIADYAEGIGSPDPERMRLGLERYQSQLANMAGVAGEYLRDLADAGRFGTPPTFDVWGEDEAEVNEREQHRDRDM